MSIKIGAVNIDMGTSDDNTNITNTTPPANNDSITIDKMETINKFI